MRLSSCQRSRKTRLSRRARAPESRVKEQLSCVRPHAASSSRCRVAWVTFHMSRVTCHMSRVSIRRPVTRVSRQIFLPMASSVTRQASPWRVLYVPSLMHTSSPDPVAWQLSAAVATAERENEKVRNEGAAALKAAQKEAERTARKVRAVSAEQSRAQLAHEIDCRHLTNEIAALELELRSAIQMVRRRSDMNVSWLVATRYSACFGSHSDCYHKRSLKLARLQMTQTAQTSLAARGTRFGLSRTSALVTNI